MDITRELLDAIREARDALTDRRGAVGDWERTRYKVICKIGDEQRQANANAAGVLNVSTGPDERTAEEHPDIAQRVLDAKQRAQAAEACLAGVAESMARSAEAAGLDSTPAFALLDNPDDADAREAAYRLAQRLGACGAGASSGSAERVEPSSGAGDEGPAGYMGLADLAQALGVPAENRDRLRSRLNRLRDSNRTAADLFIEAEDSSAGQRRLLWNLERVRQSLNLSGLT